MTGSDSSGAVHEQTTRGNNALSIESLAARRGVIKPVVSNRFKLSQSTEALKMLKDGKIIGSGVMINP